MVTLIFYNKTKINTIFAGELTKSIFDDGKQCLASIETPQGIKMLAVNSQGSVVCERGLQAGAEIARAYSVYGESDLDTAGPNPVAFIGAIFDHFFSGYNMGNGYRNYSPTLRRFFSQDALSPFGRGGLNSYCYCLCDPINFIDSNGGSPQRAIANWRMLYNKVIDDLNGGYSPAALNENRLNLQWSATKNLYDQGRMSLQEREVHLSQAGFGYKHALQGRSKSYVAMASKGIDWDLYYAEKAVDLQPFAMKKFLSEHPRAIFSKKLQFGSAVRAASYLEFVAKAPGSWRYAEVSGILPKHLEVAQQVLSSHPRTDIYGFVFETIKMDFVQRMEPWVDADTMETLRGFIGN